MRDLEDLEGLDGLDGTLTAFDSATREGRHHDFNGAWGGSSMDDSFEHSNENSIIPENAGMGHIGNDNSEVQVEDTPMEVPGSDGDDPEDGAVSEGAELKENGDNIKIDAKIEAQDSIPNAGSPPGETKREEDEASKADGSPEGDLERAFADQLDWRESDTTSNSGLAASSVKIEVQLYPLPAELVEDYSTVLSEIVDYIHEEEAPESYRVEFTDGRVETVSFISDSSMHLSNTPLPPCHSYLAPLALIECSPHGSFAEA